MYTVVTFISADGSYSQVRMIPEGHAWQTPLPGLMFFYSTGNHAHGLAVVKHLTHQLKNGGSGQSMPTCELTPHKLVVRQRGLQNAGDLYLLDTLLSCQAGDTFVVLASFAHEADANQMALALTNTVPPPSTPRGLVLVGEA